MFRCTECRVVQAPRTKPTRLPFELRKVVYREKGGVNKGKGTEIAKEGDFCPTCAPMVEARLDIGEEPKIVEYDPRKTTKK